jgi:hypothetical protein
MRKNARRWIVSSLAVLPVLLLVATSALADHEHDRDHDRDGDDGYSRSSGPPVVVDRGWYLRNLNESLDDLDRLSDANDDNPNRQSRKEVRQEIAELRAMLVQTRDDVSNAPIVRNPGPIPPPMPTPPIGPQPMSDGQFQSVLQAINQAYYTSQKYVVLQDVAQQNWFTCDQVVAVMNELYWNSDKVKAAAMLYPHVVDKKSWFKVYGALAWDSDKEELRKLTTGGRPQ